MKRKKIIAIIVVLLTLLIGLKAFSLKVVAQRNALTPFFSSPTPGPTNTPTPTIDPTILALSPTASPSAKPVDSGGISLFLYIVLAAVFIMVIHFALAIGNEFNLYLMTALFFFAGVIGWWMHSYEAALVLGIILSLLFW